MLDGLKNFVGVNRLAQLAPMIAERWCDLDPSRASLRWRAEERAERLRSRSPGAVAPTPPVILVDAEEPMFAVLGINHTCIHDPHNQDGVFLNMNRM